MYYVIKESDAEKVNELLKQEGIKHDSFLSAYDIVIHNEIDFVVSSAKAMVAINMTSGGIPEDEALSMIEQFDEAEKTLLDEADSFTLIDDTFDQLKSDIEEKLKELVPEKFSEFI